MNFDEIIDRTGTHCAKWDMLPKLYGLDPKEAIAMWVADMDFRSPDCVIEAARRLTEHGVFGYRGDYESYHAAIAWWMEARHGWKIEHDWIFTTYGLVNAINMALHAFTEPGDEVVIFSPVYHVFRKAIREAHREVRECELALGEDGRYYMDFEAYDAQMSGRERAVILCSPHNPGGRLWTREELAALGDWAAKHDLLLIADEIHHDLVFPGERHVPMILAAPGHADRTLMLTAPSKTFNIAGNHCGNVIIPDDRLRATFADTMAALHVAPTIFGTAMTEAAYSPQGAEWLDALNPYLAENARIFLDAMNALPGVRAMPMQSTYLAWVDFSGTGMSAEEVNERVVRQARIAPSYGPTFGKGGETFLRFNLGLPRPQLREAVERLKAAFADLQ